MDLVLTVIEVVAPVFLLAAIGFGWVRLGQEYRIEFVTKLAMTLGVPALIFVALMETEIEPAALTSVSLAAFFAYLGLSVVFWLVLRVMGLDMRTYLAPLIFGNTGNLGLPLCLFAFGEAGFAYAVVVFAVMAILNFTFGLWLVSGGASVLRIAKEPLVLATLLGALFLIMDWETPTFLTNALRLVGQLAIPLMLITLGVAISRLTPKGLGRAVALSLVKVVAAVGVGWVTASLFALPPVAFAVLVVEVATPVAVTSYLLAEKYGADSESVAGLVVTSTLMSVGALPLILALFI
ncbi:AEC family transporter [uncultured Maritimibacter sp.]|uniref:AEC family transporter n=1 Tax=uncultured Maritimibacter sp. TaxID=991866 RepID=UPI000AE27A57|nr:AEC family transporter [uncultured Maritimibacter sp.]